ncbi:MAG: MFS transporter [Chloroflexi bacterium]|nr:MFS transporter [Chloroflexota bacterium]MCL5273541.1 MFS transporter [Chloroflexota bacterium]
MKIGDPLRKFGGLSWYVAATLFNSTFTSLTVFGPAFIFFLDDMGLDKARIGVLLALIPFAGIVAPAAASAVGKFGLKRTFVLFWGIRKAAFAFILLVPLVLRQLGTDTAFAWVAGIILAFSLCRAIAETGFYPWLQELIPNAIRGKFSAVNGIVATLVTLATTAASSYVIDHMVGIERFMILFAVGIVFGVLAVLSYAMLPGGAPVQTSDESASRSEEMRHALRDTNFIRFLLILALITLGGSIGGSFVALYANEQVGLSSGNVVLLTIGSSIGALISSYPLGWASDRYGSRPLMVLGLITSLVGPVGWLIMPRHSLVSLPFAMILSFLGALAGTAWATGSGRYFFVNAVPPDQKTGYMAVWYAWNAIIGGAGPLIAGWLLRLLSGMHSSMLGFTIDAYTPLFVFNALTLIVGAYIAHRMRDDEALPLRTVFSIIMRRPRPVLLLRNRIK